jgi:hypothetical protein
LPDSGASAGGSGAAMGTGGAPIELPSGGVISPQCAACATAGCQPEAAVCKADAACWKMGVCVTTCLGPTCVACFGGPPAASSEFNSLECCTSRKCGALCPSLNGGVIGCP